jgi:hypothetical protein
MLKVYHMSRCCIALLVLVSIVACKKKASTTQTETAVIAENKTGVILYPKSTQWGPGNSGGEQSGTTATAQESDDSPQKVIEFYNKQLKNPKVTSDNLGEIIHTTVTGKTKDGAEAEVSVMKLPQQKTQIFISVRRESAAAIAP